MNHVSKHLLPNGTLQHDFGRSSCLSCGGRVTATYDDNGLEHANCIVCGDVVYVVFDNDAGTPVQGFMTPAELRGFRIKETDDGPPW